MSVTLQSGQGHQTKWVSKILLQDHLQVTWTGQLWIWIYTPASTLQGHEANRPRQPKARRPMIPVLSGIPFVKVWLHFPFSLNWRWGKRPSPSRKQLPSEMTVFLNLLAIVCFWSDLCPVKAISQSVRTVICLLTCPIFSCSSNKNGVLGVGGEALSWEPEEPSEGPDLDEACPGL